MSKFFMGLVLGILGFIVWVIGSIFWAVADATKDTNPDVNTTPWIVIVSIGFAIMLGGPLLYWFVLPVVGWIRRRGRKEVTPSPS